MTVATYLYPAEAKVARGLLQSASIRCYLENEHSLSIVWIWTNAFCGLHMRVPVSAAGEARDIIHRALSDDAVDEPVNEVRDEEEKFSPLNVIDPRGRCRRWLLVLAILLFASPNVNYLYLFIVFR